MCKLIVEATVACLLVVGTATGKEPHLLTISIEPTRLDIRAFDPMILRVFFINQSDKPVEGANEPTAANGLLKFELRKKGELEYRRIVSRTENLSSNTLTVGTKEVITPKGQRATTVVIVETPKVRLFDGPGAYQLRAVVVDSNELAGASDPIQINVEASPPEHLQAVERASRTVVREMAGGISMAANQGAIRDAVGPLPDCELKRIGKLLADIIAIRDANTRDSFTDARRRVEENRKALPPPTQDWAGLTLSNMYYEMERLDLAQEEARRLPKSSFDRDALERRIRQKRAEHGANPAVQ